MNFNLNKESQIYKIVKDIEQGRDITFSCERYSYEFNRQTREYKEKPWSHYFRDALLRSPFHPSHYVVLVTKFYDPQQKIFYDDDQITELRRILRERLASDQNNLIVDALKKGDKNVLDLNDLLSEPQSQLIETPDDRVRGLAAVLAHPNFDDTSVDKIKKYFGLNPQELNNVSVEAKNELKDGFKKYFDRNKYKFGFQETLNLLTKASYDQVTHQQCPALLSSRDLIECYGPSMFEFNQSQRLLDCRYLARQEDLKEAIFFSAEVEDSPDVREARHNFLSHYKFYDCSDSKEPWSNFLNTCAAQGDTKSFAIILQKICSDNYTSFETNIFPSLLPALDQLDHVVIASADLSKKIKKFNYKPPFNSYDIVRVNEDVVNPEQMIFAASTLAVDDERLQSLLDSSKGRMDQKKCEKLLLNLCDIIRTPPQGFKEDEILPLTSQDEKRLNALKSLINAGVDISPKNFDVIEKFTYPGCLSTQLQHETLSLVTDMMKRNHPYEAYPAIDRASSQAWQCDVAMAFRKCSHRPLYDSMRDQGRVRNDYVNAVNAKLIERGLMPASGSLPPSGRICATVNVRNLDKLDCSNPGVTGAFLNCVRPILQSAREEESRILIAGGACRSSGTSAIDQTGYDQFLNDVKNHKMDSVWLTLRRHPEYVQHKNYAALTECDFSSEPLKMMLDASAGDFSEEKRRVLKNFACTMKNKANQHECWQFPAMDIITTIINFSDVALHHPDEMLGYVAQLDDKKTEKSFYRRIYKVCRPFIVP